MCRVSDNCRLNVTSVSEDMTSMFSLLSDSLTVSQKAKNCQVVGWLHRQVRPEHSIAANSIYVPEMKMIPHCDFVHNFGAVFNSLNHPCKFLNASKNSNCSHIEKKKHLVFNASIDCTLYCAELKLFQAH